MGASGSGARTDELKQHILQNGAVVVGVADVRAFFKEGPSQQLFVLVFGLRYPDADIELLPDDRELQTSLQRVAGQAKRIYADTAISIDATAPLARHCRIDKVEQTFAKMSKPLSLKAMAVLAGLGWVGRSSLLVIPEHGPRIRLGAMVTDAPLVADEPFATNGCGACWICQEACPARAVSGEEVSFGGLLGYRIDRAVCEGHLRRHEHSLQRREFCGLCLKECPVGRARV